MLVSMDLTEHVVRSHAVPIERKVWASAAVGGRPEALLVFLDGELYLERVGAATVVEQLQRSDVLPPVAAAFVSNNGPAARHDDFTCRPDYSAFIAGDVCRWMINGNPGVDKVVLVGLSLSGLAAAFAATQYPSIFAGTICQSPSFWWEAGRFYKELGPASRAGVRLWVCVGDRETAANVSHPPSGMLQQLTQIEGCDFGVTSLRRNGYDVTFRTFPGGHDPNCWRDDLMLALPWACRENA
jgi:enterochelin esterase family protein